MNFLGLIFRCTNGKFVKVEKEGAFEMPNGRFLEGYAGREITQLGKIVSDYIYWDKNGRNPRNHQWDLVETRTGTAPELLEKDWPTS